MELNRWYYITYQKKEHKLNIFYDGEKVASDDIGNVQWNDGPIYIGRDPWYNGVAGAGFDNIQIHNRALSEAEIERTAAGMILFNDNLVLALDFAGGVVDGVIHDMSPFLHHAKVHGNPEMVPGGLGVPVLLGWDEKKKETEAFQKTLKKIALLCMWARMTLFRKNRFRGDPRFTFLYERPGNRTGIGDPFLTRPIFPQNLQPNLVVELKK